MFEAFGKYLLPCVRNRNSISFNEVSYYYLLQVQAILRPILKDEMILSRLKKPEEPDSAREEKLTDREQLINMVNKAVTSITNRLNSLAHFEGLDSKVSRQDCI